MDFDAIEEFWFGELKTPEFPFEPIDLGITFPQEHIEFINPFEVTPQEA